MDSNEKREPLNKMGLNLGIFLQKNAIDQLPDYEVLQKRIDVIQSTIKDINTEIKNISEKVEVCNSRVIAAIKNELDGLKKTKAEYEYDLFKQEFKGKIFSIGLDYKERGWCLCPCLRTVLTASALVMDLNCDRQLKASGKYIPGDRKVKGLTVKFDIDPTLKSGSDLREKTEWPVTDSGTGFLVWDFDKDGKITSSKELFGNFDIDGEAKFEDGYKKLAHYFDKNKDGLISGAELTELAVWSDSNADGITQPEELKSLSEFGISSLDIRNINAEDKSIIFKYIAEC